MLVYKHLQTSNITKEGLPIPIFTSTPAITDRLFIREVGVTSGVVLKPEDPFFVVLEDVDHRYHGPDPILDYETTLLDARNDPNSDGFGTIFAVMSPEGIFDKNDPYLSVSSYYFGSSEYDGWGPSDAISQTTGECVPHHQVLELELNQENQYLGGIATPEIISEISSFSQIQENSAFVLQINRDLGESNAWWVNRDGNWMNTSISGLPESLISQLQVLVSTNHEATSDIVSSLSEHHKKTGIELELQKEIPHVNNENNIYPILPDGSREIHFRLKLDILQAAKKPNENLIASQENEIALLTKHQGSIVRIPSVNLKTLIENLPYPECDIAHTCLNESMNQLPELNMLVSSNLDQAFVITPAQKAPFIEADVALRDSPYDLELARSQISGARSPIVVATHKTDQSIDHQRENRWILMQDNGILYLTSPGKLTSNLVDFTSFLESILSTNDNPLLGKLDPQNRSKLINSLLIEALSISSMIEQNEDASSPIDRSKSISSLVSPDTYTNEIKSIYSLKELSEIYKQEYEIQHKGLKEAVMPLLNPDTFYQQHLKDIDMLRMERQKEYSKKLEAFRKTFSDYGRYRCNLIDVGDSFECEISDKNTSKVIQKISFKDMSADGSGQSGIHTVWLDSKGQQMEKPKDRSFIGPEQKLKVLNDTRRRTLIEAPNHEDWRRTLFHDSALSVGYKSLPFGVRKGLKYSEDNFQSVFDVVVIQSTDQALKQRKKTLYNWLLQTSDHRAIQYQDDNGQINPLILTLDSEYSEHLKRQEYLNCLRKEVRGLERQYDQKSFMALNQIDPRKSEDSRKALNLFEESGVIVVEAKNSEEICEKFPNIGEILFPKIDAENAALEIFDLYPETINDKAGYEELLKNLPTTQQEYDLLLREADEYTDYDRLSRAVLMNYKVLWRAHVKSSDTDIDPNISLKQVRTILQFLDSNSPIPLSIFYACCEATNPLKITQQTPDISEYYFLKKLETLSTLSETIHKPGLRWNIVNEASIAGNLLGISSEQVEGFEKEMLAYLKASQFNSIDIIDMRKVIVEPFEHLQQNEIDLSSYDDEQLSDLWTELSRIGVSEGDFKRYQLLKLLQDPNLFNNLLQETGNKMKVAKHRTEAFATSVFMPDLGLDLNDEQLLSLSGQHTANTNAFDAEISRNKIQSEVMEKWVRSGTENARFFDSHMQLRPLIRIMGELDLIETHEVLKDSTIPSTITRKEDKLVISPTDNGIFPTHGFGCLTPNGRMNVVQAHEILSQPNRYVLVTVGDRIIATLDTPDDFVEEQAINAGIINKDN